MATVSPEIIDKVKSFAQSVSKDIKIGKIYLFGSYAKGQAGEDSDIDILVISDDFKKMPPVEVGFLLFRKAASIPGDLQPVGYTPDELLNNNNLFLQEILPNAMEISLH